MSRDSDIGPRSIILIDFPFTIPTISKVRPAAVLAETEDQYKDLLVCAISSVVPSKLSTREILIKKEDPVFEATGLRVDSVIKVDRIATLGKSDVIVKIGRCAPGLWKGVVTKFRKLV